MVTVQQKLAARREKLYNQHQPPPARPAVRAAPVTRIEPPVQNKKDSKNKKGKKKISTLDISGEMFDASLHKILKFNFKDDLFYMTSIDRLIN